MPERDGYIPGVPCWIDTSQPDPEAAVAFYSGLFGWEFEDVMPPDSPGKYFIARIRGGDVAAVGLAARRARRRWRCGTPTSGSRAPTRRRRRCEDAGGNVLMEPFDVMDAGRMAVFADPEGAVFCVWQAKEHKGAQGRQRARLAELQRPEHPRRRRPRRPSTARCSAGRRSALAAAPRCGRCPATATTSSATTPASASGWPRSAGPPGFEDVVAAINPIPDDQPDVPAHWSVTFGVDDADAIAGEGDGARRQGARPAVRRAVGADDGHRRSAGRDVHGEQVRAGEQGPRRPGGLGGRRLIGRLGGGAGALRPRRRRALGGEALGGPGARLGRLDLAVLRRRRGHEPVEQASPRRPRPRPRPPRTPLRWPARAC